MPDTGTNVSRINMIDRDSTQRPGYHELFTSHARVLAREIFNTVRRVRHASMEGIPDTQNF